MVKSGEKYIHYKHPSHPYEVIGVARHTDNINQMIVIYRAFYESPNPAEPMWAQPLEEFTGEVSVNGVKVPRFKKI